MLRHGQYTQVAFWSSFPVTRRLKYAHWITLFWGLQKPLRGFNSWLVNQGQRIGPCCGLSARQSNSCLPRIEEKKRYAIYTNGVMINRPMRYTAETYHYASRILCIAQYRHWAYTPRLVSITRSPDFGFLCIEIDTLKFYDWLILVRYCTY